MTAAHFEPPYLRWSVPNERAEILRRRAEIRKAIELQLGASTQTGSGKLSAVPDINTPRPVATNLASPRPASVAEQASATAAVTVGGRGQQSRAGAVACIIDPPGPVTLGWFCNTQFRARIVNVNNQHLSYSWTLFVGEEKLELGDTGSDVQEIFFVVNQPTYAPVLPPPSSVEIRVECTVHSIWHGSYTSDPVTLNFDGLTACVRMIDAYFPDEPNRTLADVKGGDHGARPKVRIKLDGPAGPTGQTVHFTINDTHNPTVLRFLNSAVRSFVIPPGATEGDWAGFLGTRKVLSTKTVSVTAHVNDLASVPLTLTVQK